MEIDNMHGDLIQFYERKLDEVFSKNGDFYESNDPDKKRKSHLSLNIPGQNSEKQKNSHFILRSASNLPFKDNYINKGENAPQSGEGNGKGLVISALNASAAYGVGLSVDMGMVFDATGNEKTYFTIGLVGGIGATAGVGVNRANKNFRVDDIGGEGIIGNVTLPFFKGVTSIDFFGDSHKLDESGGYPFGKVRGFGLNLGVGAGVFGGWSYTFLAPPPPKINYPYMYFSTFH